MLKCGSVWANHVLLLRSDARGHWPITVGDGVPKEGCIGQSRYSRAFQCEGALANHSGRRRSDKGLYRPITLSEGVPMGGGVNLSQWGRVS
eukprot:scaffold13999_cov69-Cylindrotheca_fusiformis.AAC.1